MTTVLKNKNFLLVWVSQLLSQVTINFINFIVIVNIFETTGSTLKASYIWVAYSLPAILIGPIAATYVDIADRKKVLQVTNLAQASIILFFVLLNQTNLFLAYSVVFFYSLFNQFYVPAEAAALPHVVKKNNLPQANSLFFVSQQASVILGFGLSSLTLEYLGFRATLFLAAGFLFLALAAVSALPKILVVKIKKCKSLKKQLKNFFKEILFGYKFITSHNRITFIFILLIWLQITLAILTVNLPIIGTDIIKTKPSLTGVLIVVPVGVGALIGAYLSSKILEKGIRKKKVIDFSLLTLSISFIVGISAIIYSEFWLGRLIAMLVFALVGASFVGTMIPSITLLQELTPEKYMARVFGNFWFITTVLTVIPVLFSATVTDNLGIVTLLYSIGVVGLFALFLSKKLIPDILTKTK